MNNLNYEEIQVSLIILNFNTKKMTEDCINSYLKNFDEQITYEIILIDNNSSDGSKEYFTEKYSLSKRIKLVFNDSNIGFGNGNNIGASLAKGEFLVFANSDTIIKKLNVLNLINCFKEVNNIGILSCKIMNNDDSIQSVGYNFPSIWNDIKLNFLFWNFNFVKKIRYRNYMERGLFQTDWLTGSFFMCKRTDFLEINGFDSSIFMYAEDLDLCARMKALGRKNYIFDKEEIYHLHGKSSGGNNVKFQNLLESKKNYLYVLKKNDLVKYPYLLYLFSIIHIFILTVGKTFISNFKSARSNYCWKPF